MDPCALTVCGIFSVVGSVLCFFGVRKCMAAPSQEENIEHKPPFHITPRDSKYERTKRSVHHIKKERNRTNGTIYPMDSASHVNIHHRRAGLRSGTLNIPTPSVHAMNSGNSARSLTSSMWEEVCAGLTPSEIEAYTPHYTGGDHI
jgi:hypothetical protein